MFGHLHWASSSKKRAREPTEDVCPIAGVDSMGRLELQRACKSRGIKANGKTAALASALKQELADEAASSDMVHPAPICDHESARLYTSMGQLWGSRPHRPHRSDVMQGRLNDCYFVCALNVLAQAAPEAIERCFEAAEPERRGYRRFKVQLFRGHDRSWRNPHREDIERAFKRVAVTVDNRFWQDGHGNEIYTHSDCGALWPGLLEKAYIKMRGRNSYRDIEGDVNNEGHVVRVVRAIEPRLGCLVTPLPPMGDKSRLLRKLLSESNDFVAYSAGTRPKGSAVFSGGGGALLHAEHSYLVEGLQEKDGELHAIIRNPHNRDGSFDAMKLHRVPSPRGQSPPPHPPRGALARTPSLLSEHGLNCDHKVGAALVPLADFNKYFLSLSSFHWIVPRTSPPISNHEPTMKERRSSSSNKKRRKQQGNGIGGMLHFNFSFPF